MGSKIQETAPACGKAECAALTTKVEALERVLNGVSNEPPAKALATVNGAWCGRASWVGWAAR